MNGWVEAVHRSPNHSMSKPSQLAIQLLMGEGVEGDTHRGVTVQHRSRVAADATQPNLRQVHLIHAELHDELQARGFPVTPGLMGENITTRGIDLLSLPTGAVLQIGPEALIEITGLRNPCAQLDGLAPGLMAAVLEHDAGGALIRKAGVMAIVTMSGRVEPGDTIEVRLPPQPWLPLRPV